MPRKEHNLDKIFSDKYIALRKRYIDTLMFKGESVAELSHLNNGSTLPKVVFSDQTLYLGLALMTFAMESQILREAGLKNDSHHSDHIIVHLLDAFERLQGRAADELFQNNPLGFFIRDSVSNNNRREFGIDKVYGKHYKLDSDFIRGQTSSLISQDQVIHVVVGLWAVQEYSPINAGRAKKYLDWIFTYLVKNTFIITNPDTAEIPTGGNAEFMSLTFHEISMCIFNKEFSNIDLNFHGFTTIVNILLKIFSLFKVSTLHLQVRHLDDIFIDYFQDTKKFEESMLKQINEIDIVARRKLEQLCAELKKIVEKQFEEDSYIIHMGLLAACFLHQVDGRAFIKKATEFNHFLSPLLRSLVQYNGLLGGLSEDGEQADISWQIADATQEVARDAIRIHKTCPFDGPHATSKIHDWRKDNRWVRTNDLEPTTIAGNEQLKYNGLDFLLLETTLLLSRAMPPQQANSIINFRGNKVFGYGHMEITAIGGSSTRVFYDEKTDDGRYRTYISGQDQIGNESFWNKLITNTDRSQKDDLRIMAYTDDDQVFWREITENGSYRLRKGYIENPLHRLIPEWTFNNPEIIIHYADQFHNAIWSNINYARLVIGKVNYDDTTHTFKLDRDRYGLTAEFPHQDMQILAVNLPNKQVVWKRETTGTIERGRIKQIFNDPNRGELIPNPGQRIYLAPHLNITGIHKNIVFWSATCRRESHPESPSEKTLLIPSKL